MSQWILIDDQDVVLRAIIAPVNPDDIATARRELLDECAEIIEVDTSDPVAGPGSLFMRASMTFANPPEYTSWVWIPGSNYSGVWAAPVPMPTDGWTYTWDDDAKAWTRLGPVAPMPNQLVFNEADGTWSVVDSQPPSALHRWNPDTGSWELDT